MLREIAGSKLRNLSRLLQLDRGGRADHHFFFQGGSEVNLPSLEGREGAMHNIFICEPHFAASPS